MASNSGLMGPYQLTPMGIDNAVTKKSAGSYLLGKTEGEAFKVYYAGRADEDINSRLKQHVSAWYPEFKFDYFPSAKTAFEKECDLYHEFNPPDNEVHPCRPKNSSLTCPRCSALG